MLKYPSGTIELTQSDLPRLAPGTKLVPQQRPISQTGQHSQDRVLVATHATMTQQTLQHANMATFDFKDSDPEARIKTSITKKNFASHGQADGSNGNNTPTVEIN